MTLESDAKFEGKLALGFEYDMVTLANFNASSGKSENVHFDVILLSIAYKNLAEEVLKNYLSWHWRVNQTLKKNSIFVRKMAWEMWRILTRAVNLHFDGIFMSNLCNVWAKIIQMNFVAKNDLRFQKWRKEFSEFLHK